MLRDTSARNWAKVSTKYANMSADEARKLGKNEAKRVPKCHRDMSIGRGVGSSCGIFTEDQPENQHKCKENDAKIEDSQGKSRENHQPGA